MIYNAHALSLSGGRKKRDYLYEINLAVPQRKIPFFTIFKKQMKTASWNVTNHAFLTETLVFVGSATAHVKWLSIMVPIYLYFVAQLSCKGRFSCSYILGQTLRRHKPAQPISQLLLSHSISLDTLRTRHSERVPTQHPLPGGVWEPNSVGLPVSLWHQNIKI